MLIVRDKARRDDNPAEQYIFLCVAPKKTDLYVTCINPNEEKREIIGFDIISLTPGCRASMNSHILTSGIEIEDDIGLKLKFILTSSN